MSQLLHGLRAGTPFAAALGARVRAEREAAGMSQAQAARSLNVGPSYLSKVERGEKAPSADMLEMVSQWRGTPLDALLFGETLAESAAGAGFVAEDVEPYGLRQAPFRLVGRASAKADAEMVWDAIDPPEIVDIPRTALWLEIRGDWIAPVVWDGQRVVYDPKQAPGNGDLAYVRTVAGAQYIARYWEDSGEIVLQSLRPPDPRRPERPEPDVRFSPSDIDVAARIIMIDLRTE